MTKQEWAQVAKVLADFYPHNFKLADVGAVRNWYLALADLPGERVAAAIWSMVRTQPAFPSVADIRRLAEGQADAPAEAWAEAMRLVREHGTAPEHRRYVPKGEIALVDGKVVRLSAERGETEPCEVADPILAKTLAAIGGLAAVGNCDNARLDTLRAQFLKLYAGFAAEHKRQETFEALGVPSQPLALLEGRRGPTATLVEVIQQITPSDPAHQEDQTP